jgi:hypothetical protein
MLRLTGVWELWLDSLNERALTLRAGLEALSVETDPDLEGRLQQCCRSIENYRDLEFANRRDTSVESIERLSKADVLGRFGRNSGLFGIDGMPLDVVGKLRTNLEQSAEAFVIQVNIWGRKGLEKLPESVAGRACCFIFDSTTCCLLHVIESVFRS